ncbi:hypothetical protein PoB_005793400 [Plakobranchus ocellatus]|uniref:Uncharacterized protein n=1 Tax=Plakobranchus ocellatus TaxID=259542 RepID=A0AAV4CFH8_9GAST|nr:hypothetical protein PoB_005793400 [Plakobranchus ocellatus]
MDAWSLGKTPKSRPCTRKRQEKKSKPRALGLETKDVRTMCPRLSNDLQKVDDTRTTVVISSELQRLNIDKAALQETRLPSNGRIREKDYTFWQGRGPEKHRVHDHPRSRHWHQLDLVIIRRPWLNCVLGTRSYHSADCETDHSKVASKVQLQTRRIHRSKQKGRPRINTAMISFLSFGNVLLMPYRRPSETFQPPEWNRNEITSVTPHINPLL